MLFIVDALGALLSAFLLGVILIRFESIFGMPRKALYILAFLPCVFAVYDFICSALVKKRWGTFLKIIALANLIYCFVSIGFVFHHFQELTALGFIYFLLELVIVLIIVGIEFKAANQLNQKES